MVTGVGMVSVRVFGGVMRILVVHWRWWMGGVGGGWWWWRVVHGFSGGVVVGLWW